MTLRIYGNRRLKTLPGLATRPTTGRVREALFNIWQDRIEGCRWLDLCSGCGSIGAEALVRGAAWVCGVEQSATACRIIQENWEPLGAGRFSLYRAALPEALGWIARREAPFDLVYLDPPYDSRLYLPVLAQLLATRLLKPEGQVACEHASKHPPGLAPGWECYDERTYGRSGLSFYAPALMGQGRPETGCD
ncbi:16S rRNA (guanine(966)-N(2))-methyltransferase RsmD [Anthocerotibacter panamensis]|uniref:16S rRNA (guanine(966)-N(2))-methyltransferase RsmD n=1 Tax=Anthocerotibacter panamensis TaxID=2857077 RepID=UPI001C408B35|nr:16S rRNA (guanine(966)-N(2))-methyltransferase RsmD [Anthocerotibacter panamensis]